MSPVQFIKWGDEIMNSTKALEELQNSFKNSHSGKNEDEYKAILNEMIFEQIKPLQDKISEQENLITELKNQIVNGGENNAN